MEYIPIILLLLMFGTFLYFRVLPTIAKGGFFNGTIVKTMEPASTWNLLLKATEAKGSL